MRALLIVMLVAGAVRADPEPPRPRKQENTYRGFIIGTDLVAMLMWGGGSALTYHARNCDCEDFSGEVVVFGALTYVAMSPIWHHEMGRTDRAVASAALRIGLPIAAGELAHHAGGTGFYGSMLAAGGGMAVAMVLDWTLLAEATRPAASRTAFFITPSSGGAVAGVGGMLP